LALTNNIYRVQNENFLTLNLYTAVNVDQDSIKFTPTVLVSLAIHCRNELTVSATSNRPRVYKAVNVVLQMMLINEAMLDLSPITNMIKTTTGVKSMHHLLSCWYVSSLLFTSHNSAVVSFQ